MTPPVIATDRLTLRAPTLADFADYAAFFASPRSVYENGPLSRAAAWKEFAAPVGQWLLQGFGAWSIEERASGAYCGEVGLFHPAHDPEHEIGRTPMPGAEGRGIAYEAAAAARGWAYAALGWTTLVSYIDRESLRSIRLAGRLGAVLDPAAARPEGDECLVYRHPAPAEAA